MSNDSSLTDQKSAPKYGPFSAILVTLAAFFGSQILAGVLLGVFFVVTKMSDSEAERLLTESTVGQFFFILIVEVFTLAILFWFMRHRKISLAVIGLGRGLRFSDAGYAAVAFVGYFIVLGMIMALIEQYAPSINLEQEQQIGFDSASGPALIFVFVSLVILPPLVEEIMIRGFLYTGLRRKLGIVVSAITASLIFGAAHLQLGSGEPPLYVAAIDTFILSLVLIALRERTGSLWAGILVHALKNGIAFMALFVLHTV